MNKNPNINSKSCRAGAAALALFICVVSSCNSGPTPFEDSSLFGQKDSVRMLMDSISSAVSRNGPTAWLPFFEKSPGFFMADDGNLAFANNDSAINFINNTVSKVMKSVRLTWNNVRIDPMRADLASIGAGYHEDVTYFKQKPGTYDGYFTATAERTAQGWKLRNLHWSDKVKQ